jgi:selenocysteine lyase/cysteine desulfurase
MRCVRQTATILGYVATVVTIVGISIQQFLKSNHMNLMKFSKKLIKFSDLRPVNSSMINLDIGASSPFLEVVQDELNKWHDFVLDYAPTASQVWNCANAIYPPLQSSGIRPSKSTRRIHKIEWKGVNYLRYKLSELLHCKSENIILTSSTTRAIQIALEILEPNHIIITDKEYLMSSSLLNNFNINKGVEIHTVPLLPANCPSSEWEKTLVKNIINECKGKDKCTLIISHVCYENGIILPLDEISSLLKNSQLSSNVSIIIDAAHALGHVDFNLDIESCFYAFSGHKWLFGGCNLGGLVIPDSVRNDQSMETKIISLVHESLSLPPGLVKTQNKLSSGSIDPFVGLTTSLDALMITGFDNIKDNVVVLRKLMIQLLSESSNSIEIVKYSVPNEFIAPGILNIKAAGQAAYKVKLQRVKQILEDKNILVGHLNSGTTETLRICIPFYLLKKEVGIIAESIKSAFEEARNNP